MSGAKRSIRNVGDAPLLGLHSSLSFLICSNLLGNRTRDITSSSSSPSRSRAPQPTQTVRPPITISPPPQSEFPEREAPCVCICPKYPVHKRFKKADRPVENTSIRTSAFINSEMRCRGERDVGFVVLASFLPLS